MKTKEKIVRGSVVDVGARRGGVRANKTVRDEREGWRGPECTKSCWKSFSPFFFLLGMRFTCCGECFAAGLCISIILMYIPVCMYVY